MNSLYIWKSNPLSVIALVNIFSHSIGCLFILSMVSPSVQKLLNLVRSYLFSFVFISITLGDGSKKNLLCFNSKSILHMFSSRGFILSGPYLDLQSIFSLLYMVLENVLISFFKHLAIQFSKQHLMSILHCIFLHPLS